MFEKSHLIALAKTLIAVAIAIPSIAGGYYFLYKFVTYVGN
jgi:hypothetical protein